MIIKVVVFDLWNTLVFSEKLKFTQRIAKVLNINEDYVLDYIRSSSSRNKEIHYTTILREIWNYRNKKSVPIKLLKDIENEYQEFIKTSRLDENAEACIRILKENKIKTAIVSNATSISIDIVKKFSLEKKIDKIYLSCQTGFLKPDPRAFSQVLTDFNVKPNQVCVVGDKITTDVLGAKIAQMNVIWYAPNLKINNSNIPIDMRAIINNLINIPKYL